MKARQSEIRKQFTDDLVRVLPPRGGENTGWRDSIEPSLYLYVSPYEKRSLFYKHHKFIKLIGDVHEVTVDRAREIARNVDENIDEVKNTEFQDRIPLCRDFAKNGAFPRKEKAEAEDARVDREAIAHEINQAMTILANIKRKLFADYELKLF